MPRRRSVIALLLVPWLVLLGGCDRPADPADSADPPPPAPSRASVDAGPPAVTEPPSLPPTSLAPTSAAPTSAAPGCAGDPHGAEPGSRGGRAVSASLPAMPDRSYLVAVPPAGVDRRHLVLALHGHGGSSDALDAETAISALGTARGFVVVIPQALGEPARWNFDHRPDGPDDGAFLRALIDDALERYCITTDRVFVVGSSNGAAMAGLYACTDPRVAAVAMVIATVPDTCPAGWERPSVLSIRGDADTTVPYDGADALVATWAAGAGCTGGTVASDPWPGVTRLDHDGCPDGTAVALVTVHGGIHAWPGGTRPHPGNSDAGTTYPATEAVLDLFTVEQDAA